MELRVEEYPSRSKSEHEIFAPSAWASAPLRLAALASAGRTPTRCNLNRLWKSMIMCYPCACSKCYPCACALPTPALSPRRGRIVSRLFRESRVQLVGWLSKKSLKTFNTQYSTSDYLRIECSLNVECSILNAPRFMG